MSKKFQTCLVIFILSILSYGCGPTSAGFAQPSPTNTINTPTQNTPTVIPSKTPILPTETSSPTQTSSPSPTQLATETTTPTPVLSCPGAPPIRTTVGNMAKISESPNLPQRVREEPQVNAKQIGKVNPGELITITEGFQCADSYTWWKIRTENNLEGWVAEANQEAYWLIDLGRPAATSTQTETPTPHQKGINISDIEKGLPSNAILCEIELSKNLNGCEDIAAIKAQNPIENGSVVLKLDLRSYKQVRFYIYYGDAPDGWSVNIGDSESNNGYAGDGGDQSNDAEIQIVNGGLAIYGNDYIPPDQTTDKLRHIRSIVNFVKKDSLILLKVGNGLFGWSETDQLRSPYLYALNGQKDDEGSTNYEIYAAFNRVIGTDGRSGTGVTHIVVALIR